MSQITLEQYKFANLKWGKKEKSSNWKCQSWNEKGNRHFAREGIKARVNLLDISRKCFKNDVHLSMKFNKKRHKGCGNGDLRDPGDIRTSHDDAGRHEADDRQDDERGSDIHHARDVTSSETARQRGSPGAS